MHQIVYAASPYIEEIVKSFNLGLDIRPGIEFPNPLSGKPIFIGEDGYQHHKTLELVKQVPRHVTYIHIDAHTDRYAGRTNPPDCTNFTFNIAELPYVVETIYLGVQNRFLFTNPIHFFEIIKSSQIFGVGRTEISDNCLSLSDSSTFFSSPRGVFSEATGIREPPTLLPQYAELLDANASVTNYFMMEFLTPFLLVEFRRPRDFDPRIVQTQDVYLTVDVDVLAKGEEIPIASGNSQGTMTIEELLGHIGAINLKRNIVGFDIHGINWDEDLQSSPVPRLIEGIIEAILLPTYQFG